MEERKTVLAINGLCFKKLFASDSNAEILIGFINDFYDMNVKEVSIENPYSIEDFDKALYQRNCFSLEVAAICTADDDKKFRIKMQINRAGFYEEKNGNCFINRYTACESPEAVEDKRIKSIPLYLTYTIDILERNLFEDEAGIHIFDLYDLKNKLTFTTQSNREILRGGFFELNKKDVTLNENMKFWQEFFLTGEVSENAPDYIKKARQGIFTNSFDADERAMINHMEMMIKNAKAREAYILEECIEKEKISIARKLLKMGDSIEKISISTELSLEKVELILKEIEQEI